MPRRLKLWTDIILGIFDEIGRGFGYIPKKEYLRLDRTWEIRHRDISAIVLALEHENTDSVENILNDELQKLLDVKAFLKVLVFYPVVPVIEMDGTCTCVEIDKKIRSTKIKDSEENYLVISGVNAGKHRIIEFYGCAIDSNGKCEDLGSFQVEYTSEG